MMIDASKEEFLSAITEELCGTRKRIQSMSDGTISVIYSGKLIRRPIARCDEKPDGTKKFYVSNQITEFK
jgi:hypothetical protein